MNNLLCYSDVHTDQNEATKKLQTEALKFHNKLKLIEQFFFFIFKHFDDFVELFLNKTVNLYYN